MEDFDKVDDGSLVGHIQSGSEIEANIAFEELYRRYSPRMQYYLISKGQSYSELDDVASETWLRAFRLIGRYQYRGISFFAWLRAIADNIMKELFRQRYLGLSLDQVEEEAIIPVLHTDDMVSQVLSKLINKEAREVINGVLQDCDCPEDFRVIIESHFFHEFTTEDIMDLYDWSSSKVYTTKHRALAWLKERLLERYEGATIQTWLHDS